MARGRELVHNRQSKDPGQAGTVEGPRVLRRNLARGWKRVPLRVIRWTNCISTRKAPELNLDGGWESGAGQGVLLAPLLLCPSPPVTGAGDPWAAGAFA